MSDSRPSRPWRSFWPCVLLVQVLWLVQYLIVGYLADWPLFAMTEGLLLAASLQRLRPPTLRFFRRLPRAIAIASAEWKRAARYEFIAKERKRRRLAALKERVGYQPIGHIKPGVKPPNVVPATMRGYQPIGTVDLTNVTPPQRPSAIAPQLSYDPHVTVEMSVRGISQAADLPNFPQGVTIIGKPDPLPINPPFNPRINTIIGESTPPKTYAASLTELDLPDPRVMPPCKPGKHQWLEAELFGRGRIVVCRLCGEENSQRQKGTSNA